MWFCLSLPNSDLRKLLSKCLPGLPKEQGGKPEKKNKKKPESSFFNIVQWEATRRWASSKRCYWVWREGGSATVLRTLLLAAPGRELQCDWFWASPISFCSCDLCWPHLLDTVESSWRPFSCLLVLTSSACCLFCHFAYSMPNKLSWPIPTTQWL